MNNVINQLTENNRFLSKMFLYSLVDSIVSGKEIPIAVWSERSYAQWSETEVYYKTSWGNNKEEEMFTNVWNKLYEYAISKGVDIYFNHNVYEFIIDDELFYLGVNDNMLSISKSMATIGGKRYEF